MKRYIKSSAGDITLYKFVLVQMDMLSDITDNYDEVLHGYFYIWPYTYNKLTRDTDSEIKSHSDVIDHLPFEIRRECRKMCIWGKTDYYTGIIRFFINYTDTLSQQQIDYIKRQCKM